MGMRPAVTTASALTTIALVATIVGISTRGDDGSSAAPTSPPTSAVPVVTSAPDTSTTTAPSTTSTTTTSTTTTTTTTSTTTTIAETTTTTVAPTTSTTVELPQPVAAPADAYAAEPVVELGSIAIPRIGLERTMYEGIRLPTLDRGPGHWPGTARPGQAGNVVVAGHRTSHNADFRNLDQLGAGDEVIFTDEHGTSTYVVDSVEIVGPEATWIVEQTAEPTATLFACHPPGSVSQRIVVHLTLAG